MSHPSLAQSKLAKEIAYFEEHLEENLEKYPGKYLLIYNGDNMLGPFDTFEEARIAGWEKVGQGPFLIRETGEVTGAISSFFMQAIG